MENRNRSAPLAVQNSIPDRQLSAEEEYLVPADSAVRYRNLPTASYASAAGVCAIPANGAVNYFYRSTQAINAATISRHTARLVTANRTVRHRQRSATINEDAAATPVIRLRRRAGDTAFVQCKPSVVKDASSIVVRRGRMAIGDGETGDSDIGREIFKDAGSGAAVNGQISSTGAVDGHVAVNLKFAAGQQDRAGDAGGVNRVAVVLRQPAPRAPSLVRCHWCL